MDDGVICMERYRFFLLLTVLFLAAQNIASANPWADFVEPENTQLLKKSAVSNSHQNARLLVLNEANLRSSIDQALEQALQNRPSKGGAFEKTLTNPNVSLPLSDGSSVMVELTPSNLLSKRLNNKFNIQTYKVLASETVVSGRIDFGGNGFHAMIQTRAGETFYIDPTKNTDAITGYPVYVSYKKQDQINKGKAFSCGAKISDLTLRSTSLLQRPINGNETGLLTYRIAVAATGEYVTKQGGTVKKAMAAIATSINRVNQIFEQDLGIHLKLVENNDLIIYTDELSDPFDAENSEELLRQNQRNMDVVIGSDNYDIGHLFTTKGGGLAAIASVCNQQRKAKGVSGISHPENDSFNLDFVAHEIAHQLGATHTFNSQEGLCAGDTREAQTAFEPGSGSTIMSYAGYCGIDNLQANTDAMLHIGSIKQIRQFTSNAQGSNCGTRKLSSNSAPQVNAGTNYIIPAQTPFELTGIANDVDADELVYAWQQTDAGSSSVASDDKGDNALFRAHLPSSSSSRSFPPIADIINHSKTKGEDLPFQQRLLNFSFVAQDSHNSAQSDDMTVQVIRTGSRFALNKPRSSYNRGGTYQIFWNVAKTDQSPINCTNVDVHLATNGGYDFDQEIAVNIPNTGDAWITIPSDSNLSSRGRFKINCHNNIFFAISYRDFYVKDTSDEVGALYTDENFAESGLRDKVIEQNQNVATQSSQVVSGRVSGGSFSYWLLLILVPFMRRR